MWRTDTLRFGAAPYGWTAKPHERYYQLLGLGPDGRPARPSLRPDDR